MNVRYRCNDDDWKKSDVNPVNKLVIKFLNSTVLVMTRMAPSDERKWLDISSMLRNKIVNMIKKW